ncbi:AAA domain-containing protein [Haloarcula amylovorans]|uniref:AAA domain-containing protein n=1 Tax=Haloarcula amylovorans TaxID=2562280 RepID=UPI001076752A|nr:AAA domain-containing protein [Halomicroarcula amylolytica]
MTAVDLSVMTQVFTERYSPSLARFAERPEQADTLTEAGNNVDIEALAAQFKQFDALRTSNGVRLPLHKPDSAELTGEFVRYTEENRRTIIEYHWAAVDRENFQSVRQAGTSAIGWRLRFWTDAYDMPTVPSYMPGGDDQENKSVLELVPEQLTAAHWDEMTREEFFTHLADFVKAEKQRDRRESIDKYQSFDQNTYYAKEGGLHDAVPVYEDSGADPTRWHVSAPTEENDKTESRYICAETNLWEGTEIMIDTPPWARSPAGLPALGKVVDSETRALTVIVSDQADDRDTAMQSIREIFDSDEFVISLYPIFNALPYNRELDCIRRVQQKSSKYAPIAGNSGLSFTPARGLATQFPKLNDSQRDAAYYGLCTDDITLIHGPPGTGKTRTLVTLIKELVDRGNRVIACAHSNQATDNLLVGTSTSSEPEEGSLHEAAIDGELAIARAGSGSDNRVVQQHYVSQPAKQADVVGATMSAAAEFETNEFDVAIVDEASQASVPATFAPWLAAKRMVLAGDHKQLPPYGSDEMRNRDLEVSLYEHLVNRYGQEATQLLDTQYRMHEDIAAFPSAAFYDGQVKTVDRPNDPYTLWDLPPISAHHVVGAETQQYGTSYANEAEAEIIAQHVHDLRDRGTPSTHIGVITGYTGQIQTIRNKLDALPVSTDNVEVDTVDSFQGGERTVILMSFVRSNDAGNAGFLSLPDVGPRRLNVALTRAKKHLVLVGNWETLIAPESNRDDCSDVYADLRTWLLENDCFETTEPIEQ